MFTIYKYPIFDGSTTYHNIPKGGKILHVDHQNRQINIWVEVNTEKPFQMRTFRYFSTGHMVHMDVTKDYIHIGSVLIRPENEVYHVYELVDKV